jgi:hypothetical protein
VAVRESSGTHIGYEVLDTGNDAFLEPSNGLSPENTIGITIRSEAFPVATCILLAYHYESSPSLTATIYIPPVAIRPIGPTTGPSATCTPFFLNSWPMNCPLWYAKVAFQEAPIETPEA